MEGVSLEPTPVTKEAALSSAPVSVVQVKKVDPAADLIANLKK